MKYLPLIAMTSVLAGCSSFSSLTDVTNLVDYSNYKSVKVLEIPADLDKPAFDDTYVTNIPESVVAGDVSVVPEGVPLVDASLNAAAISSVTTVKQGSQSALQLADTGSSYWEKTTEALKSMGMTITESDQATGVLQVRDRSQVASPDTVVGAFLNRTMGRLNAGSEYQVIVRADTVSFMDSKGSALPEEESEQLLARLQKALTGS